MSYTYIKKSPYSFLETLDELRISFADKWFWVVSNVDIAERVRAKVDENFPRYTNLWFCNPKIAYEYLSEDINLWVFMPCTVSVYEKGNEVYISAWIPETVISKVVENNALDKINKDISDTMKEVIDNL